MPPSLLVQALNDAWQMLGEVPATKAMAGGLAVSYWGCPRSTQDIDIAITVPRFETLSKILIGKGLRAKSDNHLRSLGFVSVSQ